MKQKQTVHILRTAVMQKVEANTKVQPFIIQNLGYVADITIEKIYTIQFNIAWDL